MIAFDQWRQAKWENPCSLHHVCDKGGPCHDINWGTAALMGCWFMESWVAMVVKVDEISLVE